MRTSLWILTVALLLGGVLLLLFLPLATRVRARDGAAPDSARREVTVPPPELAGQPTGMAASFTEPTRQAADRTDAVPPLGEGFISGVVLGPSGEPHAGAACNLLRGTAPLGLDSVIAVPEDDGRGSEEGASVLSDAAGRFELAAPPGRWRLRVEAEGARRFEEDHLESGDFRWVRLEPAAELLVRVLDESQAPLPGARVELLQDEYSPSLRAFAHGVTDLRGSATLAVPAGRWTLAVRHSDHRPHFEPLDLEAGSTRFERTVVLSAGIRVFGRVSVGSAAPPPGTRVALDSILMFQESLEVPCAGDGRFDSGRVFSSEQVLEVAALAPGFGETRKELNLAGMPAGHDVEVHLALERPDRAAHGRVVDAHGTPVAGTSVFLKPLLALPAETETYLPENAERMAEIDVDMAPRESYQAQWRWVARTGANGEFRVGGIDYRRPYSLLLVSSHHANARLWIDAASSPSELDLGTIVLLAGGGIHGLVRSREGSSVGGLRVSTIRLERVALRGGTTFKNQRPTALSEGFQTVTNLDGEFSLEPLPAGEYYLLVAGQQFGPFAVLEGEDRGPEILELGAEAGESPSLSGRVIDYLGEPIEGCLVQLFRETERGGHALVSARTVEAEGEFRLAAPSPGPFLFRAFDIGARFQKYELRFEDVERWRAGDIVLPSNPEEGDKAIAGRILGPSGVGLADIRVTLHISPAVTGCTCVSRTVSTDHGGAFTFGPIVSGAHRLVVVDPEGGFQAREQFPVQPGDPLELQLEE